MKKLYKVILTPEERQQLRELVSTGKCSVQKIKHANIFLATDESEGIARSDAEVARLFHCHAKTVYNISGTLCRRSVWGFITLRSMTVGRMRQRLN